MSDRDAFLRALANDEDDTPTRLVYADWLEERGEHEEADRQRKWPAAKEWLVRLCKYNNPTEDDPKNGSSPTRRCSNSGTRLSRNLMATNSASRVVTT
jgi:uncharacterized protein (TIGR02996 family)